MNAPALAERLDVSCNSIYASIRNEQAGTISLNQLEKIADAMGGRLVYAIVPREGPVEEIVDKRTPSVDNVLLEEVSPGELLAFRPWWCPASLGPARRRLSSI